MENRSLSVKGNHGCEGAEARAQAQCVKGMCNGVDKQITAKAMIWRPGTNMMEWGIRNHAKLKFMEQFAPSPFVPTSAHEVGVSSFLFHKDLVRGGIFKGAIRNNDPPLVFSALDAALEGLVVRATDSEDPHERGKNGQEGLDFIRNGMKA